MHSYAPVPPPPEGAGGERGGRTRARRWLLPACVLGVLAVAVPVLWVTGGLKETPKQPEAKPGETLDLGRFEATVRDARIGTAETGLGNRRERFLIVRLRVVNKGRKTAPLGGSGLAEGIAARTGDGKWIKPEEVQGVAGGAETDVAQPDLPVEASAMWKLHPDDAPTKLTFGLRKWKYEQGFTDSEFNWIVQSENDVLVGRFTLPVAPMRVETPHAASPSATRPTGPATPRVPPTTKPARTPARTPVPRPTASRS